MGAKTQPLLRWRLSGNEYTPSTLPDRYFPTSSGLLIYSVSPDDDGVTVQCFIVLYDPSVSPPYIVVNSSIGVVRVVSGDNTTPVSSYRQQQDSTPIVSMPHQSNIATISPSPSNPSVVCLVTTAGILVVALLLISTSVLCLAIYIVRRKRGKDHNADNKHTHHGLVFLSFVGQNTSSDPEVQLSQQTARG